MNITFLYGAEPTWTLDIPHSGIRTSSWTSSCISHFIPNIYIMNRYNGFEWNTRTRSNNDLPDPCQGIKLYFSSFTQLCSLLTDYLLKIRREIFCLKGCFVVFRMCILCWIQVYICFWYDDEWQRVEKVEKTWTQWRFSRLLRDSWEWSSRLLRPFEFHIQRLNVFSTDMNVS